MASESAMAVAAFLYFRMREYKRDVLVLSDAETRLRVFGGAIIWQEVW